MGCFIPLTSLSCAILKGEGEDEGEQVNTEKPALAAELANIRELAPFFPHVDVSVFLFGE